MMCPGRVGLHVFLWTDALKTSTLKSAYRAGIRQDFYSKNILSFPYPQSALNLVLKVKQPSIQPSTRL